MSSEEDGKTSPEENAESIRLLEIRIRDHPEDITRLVHDLSDKERSGASADIIGGLQFVLWAALEIHLHRKAGIERKESGSGCVTAGKYVSRAAQTTMRKIINQYGGAEVFFVGRVGKNFIVEEAEPLAFGNQDAVPVIERLVSPGNVVLHNHPSGSLEPSQEDIALAARFGNSGIGSYIIDNKVATFRVVVPAFDANHIKRKEGTIMRKQSSPIKAVVAAEQHLGTVLKRMRMAKGWTEAQIGKKMGFLASQVKRLESGGGWNVDHLLILSKLLNVSLTDLLKEAFDTGA